MDQRSEAIHTVHILVPRFIKSEFDKFPTCRQEFIFVDVASKGLGEKKKLLSVLFSEEPELNYSERATTYIPRVPPQSWQFALYKHCISVYIATKIRQKREHTVIPSLLTKARATELKETRREAWSNCEECIFTLLC